MISKYTNFFFRESGLDVGSSGARSKETRYRRGEGGGEIINTCRTVLMCSILQNPTVQGLKLVYRTTTMYPCFLIMDNLLPVAAS